MTYTVSSGTLNITIPYHTILLTLQPGWFPTANNMINDWSWKAYA